MKRLLSLTVVAVVALSLSGCGRARTCWLWRGDRCDTCTAPTIESHYLPSTGSTLPEPIMP